MEYVLYIVLFIVIVFIGLIVYNNIMLNKNIDEMKLTHINNFITLLNAYEKLLIVDVKGYFRTDDEVGIIFDSISENVNEYLEYLSTQIDVLDMDEDFLNIQGVDYVLLNEKFLSIQRLQGKINDMYKEEQSLKLKQKYENKMNNSKSNPGGKIYINK